MATETGHGGEQGELHILATGNFSLPDWTTPTCTTWPEPDLLGLVPAPEAPDSRSHSQVALPGL